MDIVVWLRSLGLGKYEAVFRENEITEKVLPNLTAEDLKELGVAALGPPYVARCHRCSAQRREHSDSTRHGRSLGCLSPWEELGFALGQNVFAQVKSVALGRANVP